MLAAVNTCKVCVMGQWFGEERRGWRRRLVLVHEQLKKTDGLIGIVGCGDECERGEAYIYIVYSFISEKNMFHSLQFN